MRLAMDGISKSCPAHVLRLTFLSSCPSDRFMVDGDVRCVFELARQRAGVLTSCGAACSFADKIPKRCPAHVLGFEGNEH